MIKWEPNVYELRKLEQRVRKLEQDRPSGYPAVMGVTTFVIGGWLIGAWVVGARALEAGNYWWFSVLHGLVWPLHLAELVATFLSSIGFYAE